MLSDIRMPGMDGRTLLQLIRAQYPETKVVLMTAFGTVDDAVEAMKAGAYTYVTKPFKVKEVAAVLRNAAREVSLCQEVVGLRKVVRSQGSAERLIGVSPQMQEVRRILTEAATISAAVLITGRSGTGKELAARAIHFGGSRAAGPFIPVNCAAIPETLFESAMFGHRRGAFTGATESQVGLIEQASGGTLFLDEVGDIPFPQQAKLLRVIQEGEVTPVGATRPVKLDLRVVAATNRNLEAMVRCGEFREDLYYRVNVVRVQMPELSERPGDIPGLAEHLLLEIARAHGTPSLGFTEAALDALARYRWPGNVRELHNALKRALLAARGRRIDVADLPFTAGAREPMSSRPGEPPIPTAPTLAEVEKAHIESVLVSTGKIILWPIDKSFGIRIGFKRPLIHYF